MKRTWLAVIILTLTPTLFASGAKETRASTQQTQEKVKIVYWQYFFETRVNAINELIKQFEEKNPNITVEQVTFPYETFNQKVASSIPVGTGPDVLTLFGGWQPMYIKSGYLQPLPAKDFSETYFKNNFYPFVERSVKFEGKYYSVPTAVRSLALFYNKRLFREAGLDPEKPPVTLDELVSYAKKLTKYDAQGNILQAGLAMQPTGQGHNWLRDVLIRQFGGQPYSSDGRKVAYATAEGAEALRWYTDRITKDKVGYPNFATDDVTAFRTQKAAMNVDGSFRIAAYRAIADLEWGVAELPVHRGVKSNFASFWTHGISAGVSGAKLEAAVKFLRFITSPEAQILWLEKVGELPANPTLAERYRNTPYVSTFLKGLEYAHATIFVDEAGQRKVFVDMIDQVILNNKDPLAAIKEAADKEQKIIDDFWKR